MLALLARDPLPIFAELLRSREARERWASGLVSWWRSVGQRAGWAAASCAWGTPKAPTTLCGQWWWFLVAVLVLVSVVWCFSRGRARHTPLVPSTLYKGRFLLVFFSGSAVLFFSRGWRLPSLNLEVSLIFLVEWLVVLFFVLRAVFLDCARFFHLLCGGLVARFSFLFCCAGVLMEVWLVLAPPPSK